MSWHLDDISGVLDVVIRIVPIERTHTPQKPGQVVEHASQIGGGVVNKPMLVTLNSNESGTG